MMFKESGFYLLKCLIIFSFFIPSIGIAQLDTSYFLPPPPNWHLIGQATSDDYQMCYGFGDFDNDNNPELVGNYSHGAIGFYIHNYIGGNWTKSLIHPKFDPVYNIKGMLGSWHIKGFTSGDFDGDNKPEIITYADQVMYPPIHFQLRYPFPGCIYLDWDSITNSFVANPLVWGQWGEEITSNSASVLSVSPITSQFRGDGYTGVLSDFLVRTQTNSDSIHSDGRLFILEQPEETFSSYDYRYNMR